MFRMHGICAVGRNGFQEGSIGGSIREIVFSHGGRYATLRPIILLLLLYYIWNFRSLAKYYSPSLRFQETKGEKYMEHSLRELYLREAS